MTGLLVSCVGQQKASKGSRSGSGGISNTPSSVSPGYGRVFNDNPIILSGNANFTINNNLNFLLDPGQKFITSNQFLIGSCNAGGTGLSDCFEVKKDRFSGLITMNEFTWAYPVNTEEFLQVQTFSHLQDVTNNFHGKLSTIYTKLYPNIFTNPYYQSAVPKELFSSIYNAFWTSSNKLTAYSNCGEEGASFIPATNELCFGHSPNDSRYLFSQDSTIIFHEAAHTFNDILLNMRGDISNTVTERVQAGYLNYDELSAIGEGVADYYSYVMNERPHFAEWALGSASLGAGAQTRPMRESEPLHTAPVAANEDARLKYPDFLTYHPNMPEVDQLNQVPHFAGMIISHFLVALTEDFKLYCGMDHAAATTSVTHLLSETFGEMGDLTAKGSDTYNDFNGDPEYVNHSQENAAEWFRVNNSINFRNFAQVLAKYSYLAFGEGAALGNCNGSTYPKDKLEQLLDSYGLLLFSTYNVDGSGKDGGHSLAPVSISLANRKKSMLIPKALLDKDSRAGQVSAYIVDERTSVISALGLSRLANVSDQLTNSESPEISLPYNNNNARISPGEVVGIGVNLYNDSNSRMANVQVLANDWDHADALGRPCNNLGDNWPLNSEGAAVDNSGNPVAECSYQTLYNGKNTALEPTEVLAPVCFIQVSDNSSTRWATQGDFATQIALDSSKCLESGNLKNCFVRTLKGGEVANHILIKPKKNWVESLLGSSGSFPADFKFEPNNFFFLEVSPWVPPGTTFSCRLRARFSNCSDCFEDANASSDNFLDYEFSGAKPFKIINFEFIVID